MAGSKATDTKGCEDGLVSLLTAIVFTAKHDYFDAYINYHQSLCQRDRQCRLNAARGFFKSALFANILSVFSNMRVEEYLINLDKEAAEVYREYLNSNGENRDYHTKWRELVFTDP